jgi:hypothetical protein
MSEPQVFISANMPALQLGRLLTAIGREFPRATVYVADEGIDVQLREEGR